jgi:aldehyde dehydrogenase
MGTVEQTAYEAPGQAGSPVELEERYTPVTGKAFCQVANSAPDDVELALDAAPAAKDGRGECSTAERAETINAMAEVSYDRKPLGF